MITSSLQLLHNKATSEQTSDISCSFGGRLGRIYTGLYCFAKSAHWPTLRRFPDETTSTIIPSDQGLPAIYNDWTTRIANEQTTRRITSSDRGLPAFYDDWATLIANGHINCRITSSERSLADWLRFIPVDNILLWFKVDSHSAILTNSAWSCQCRADFEW